MIDLTREQRVALKRVWLRHIDPALLSYREFRRQVVQVFYDDCVMIEIPGMWLGIEKDGYTHS